LPKVSIDTTVNLKRPSVKEIWAKIRAAKRACREGKISFVDDVVIASDLLELDLLIDEFLDILPSLLDELRPENYVGSRPPQRSYKPAIKDCELFAFTWYSKSVGCQVYFKFCIKESALFIVSFHKDRAGR